MTPATPPRTPTKASQRRTSPTKRPAAQASPQVKAALQALRRKQSSLTVASNDSSDQLEFEAGGSWPSSTGTPTRREPVRQDSAFLDWGLKSVDTLIEKSYSSGRINLSSRELSHLPPALFPSFESANPLSLEDSLSGLDLAPRTPWFAREALRVLNACNNALKDINSEIAELEQLETLDLHSNLLSHLPPSISLLSNLTSLNLANNRLVEVPPAVMYLTSLNRIVLSQNSIASFPLIDAGTTDKVLPALRLLDLSKNKIASLAILSNFTYRLERSTVWSGLPDGVDAPSPSRDLSHTAPLEIRLSGNPITVFPELKQVEQSLAIQIPETSPESAIASDRLSEPSSPPPEYNEDEGKPRKEFVTELKVREDSSRAGNAAAEVVDLGGEATTTSTETDTTTPPELDSDTQNFLIGYSIARGALDASGQQLSSLPRGPIPVASTLDLHNNVLTDLDLSWFSSWTFVANLRRLYLSHNRIAVISPLAGFSFPQLTDLDLSGNRLTSTLFVDGVERPLLSVIADLAPHLSKLDLSLNKLSSTAGVAQLLTPSGRAGLRELSLASSGTSEIDQTGCFGRDMRMAARGERGLGSGELTRRLSLAQSPEDHQRTSQVVQEFLAKEGPALHNRLVEYASTRASYIEEWWSESYLNHSESVVLSLNPFFILEDDPTPARGSQLMRASSLILASLGFVHDFRTGQLPPDNFRGVPLDMSQYGKLFGCARLPTRSGCHMQVDPDSKHIVVMRRGQFYWFDALDSKNRPCLTERALLSNLAAIIADADRTPPNQVAQSALGVLSTEKRATWAGHRANMAKETGNAMCLDVLDKALFVVCLDDAMPESASELCSNMLCGTYKLENGVQVGTCTNRYYDKLQIIVAANGAAGINFEHSAVDGHTVLRFVADVYTELILRFAKSINSGSSTLFKAQPSPWATGAGKKAPGSKGSVAEEPEELDTAPKKLEWVMTSDLKMAVRFAETRLGDLICQNEAVALEFDTYGKNTITQYGFSPDAFVQMGFQAAYYSLYGRIESTYEPAMMKAFLHGRTEAIRSVTPESVAFLKVFTSDASPRDKMEALRTACKAHTELTKSCIKGLGQDRILYAMYCLSLQKPGAGSAGTDSDSDDSALVERLPALFSDAGYSTLGHSTLSTSNCGNPALRLFGFGAVVPDGSGLGYIIKDDSIAICASSKHLQTQRYLDTLSAYFVEVQRMLKELHRESNRKPNLTFVDHHVGEVDARTGMPLSHRSAYEDGWGEGYGFYGADAQTNGQKPEASAKPKPKVATGTRIQTVEI
ncbi:carnitine O-acetyltransferase, partial [Phenoliferia sp. Uapishka_3]